MRRAATRYDAENDGAKAEHDQHAHACNEDLEVALKALFATGLFADVAIDMQGSTVVVTIVENPVINQVAFEGNSEVVFFQGNYADYAEDLRRRKGDDADQPHRLRYKKLG